ncbi:MAG: phosphoribosyltransferase family protein [Bacteroidia bacterium]|nr:phosphoribosyltransferase family protein [Bacteroidia bacterium]
MVGRCVLGPEAVERVLYRMSLEILERHFGEALPLLVSVSERGTPIAQRIAGLLEREGAQPYLYRHDESFLSAQPILLIDDVLYTGQTLLRKLLRLAGDTIPAQVEVLVLVDRGHRRYPISPDYVGVQLATTLQQFVEVRPRNGSWEVWLH